MPAGRVLATQQAGDAAKQLLALIGPVTKQVGKVLQQGGILADPNQWDCGLAGKWRHDWGMDASQLRQAAAKLDELERRAQQVIEDILRADSGPVSGEAPKEPSLLGGIASGISGFIKQHAYVIADVSDVISDVSAGLGIVGLATDVVPPVGEILGAVSAGLSGVALVGHLTAKYGGGANVSGETIAADGIGLATLGIGGAEIKAGKAGMEGLEAACKGAGWGAAIDGVGIPLLGHYVSGDGAPTIFDDFNHYWRPRNLTELEMDAIPGAPIVGAFARAVEEGNKEDQKQEHH